MKGETRKGSAAGDREKSRSETEAHAADSALGDLCVCVRERRRHGDRCLKNPPFGSPRGLWQILSTGVQPLIIEVLWPKTNEFGTEGRR